MAGALRDVDADGGRWRKVEDRSRDEAVVHEHVRRSDQRRRPHGEQLGIARAGADEIDAHDSPLSPQHTNTGLSGSSRTPAAPIATHRSTWTCTIDPSRAKAARARSSTTNVATRRPPGRKRAQHASSTSRPPPPTNTRSGGGR